MNDCIEWPGGHWTTGYPYRCATKDEIADGKKRLIAIHREVWEQANGPIPPGWVIMHLCDNPGCINLDHLHAGTHKDNSLDMAAKKRGAAGWEHCRRGHEFTPENTIVRNGGKHRQCRECFNASRRAKWATKHPDPVRKRRV